MLKAFTCSDSYQEGTNSRAWLFQICKNSMINNNRRKKREHLVSDFPEEEKHWGSGILDSQKSELPTESFGDEVSEALHAIPTDCQTAILLCDVEGYSYSEIAELVEAPIGTIRSRIHRGRRMLAALLGQYAQEKGYRGRELVAQSAAL